MYIYIYTARESNPHQQQKVFCQIQAGPAGQAVVAYYFVFISYIFQYMLYAFCRLQPKPMLFL